MNNKLYDKAVAFATVQHDGQFRSGNEPYIVHPLQVAKLLMEVAPNDINLQIAGVLHDVIEDTDTTVEQLTEMFNSDIANLVYEVTKTSEKTFPNLKTKRGITLKFADRLSNVSSMEGWSAKRQQAYLDKSKFWK